MTNQLQKQTAKGLLTSPSVQAKFTEVIGKKSTQFITSVLQIVNNNKLLANADPQSILNAAMTAATLDLPINNNLGFAYIVPYGSAAQFQMGWRGFVQLAQRTGLYKTISVAAIYDGQLVSNDPLKGCEFDFSVVGVGKPIGYAAYFKLLSGYEATLYMSHSEVEAHGKKYSKTYSSGPWKDNFEAMAKKTCLKLLLSRFAPLSVEIQMAVTLDQSKVNNDLQPEYIDNQDAEIVEVDKERDRAIDMIADCTSIDELIALEKQLGYGYEVEIKEKSSTFKI
jgi:recombination protein RecT